MRDLTRRLAALSVLPVLALALAAAAPAEAKLIAYDEGLTNVDTSGNSVITAVRPATAGSNTWHWYYRNDYSGQPIAVCFSYQINNDGYKNPNGTDWTFPPEGGSTSVPGNSAACMGPYAQNATGRLPKTLTGLAEGTLAQYCATEYVLYSNIGWGWSGTYRCNAVRIDSTAPTTAVRITQGGNNVSLTNNPAAATINIDYSDAITRPPLLSGQYGFNWLCTTTSAPCNGASTFNYNAACSNGSANRTQTFTCGLGNLSDGTHHKCFAVYDGAVLDAIPSQAPADPSLGTTPAPTYSLNNNVIACDSVSVDTVAPDTSITAGPGEGSTITTNSTSFSFTGSGSPTSYECQRDSLPYETCTSPRQLTGLSNGPHVFRVRAKDAAGNLDGSPVVRNFNVAVPDSTPPETTITAGPADGSSTATTVHSFSFSASEDSNFACSLDGGSFTACSSPFTTDPLGVGSHTFAVRATDIAGNPDPSPASRTFTVTAEPGGGGGGGSGGGGGGGGGSAAGDTQKPETTIKDSPKAKTSSTTAKFTFEADEAATFQCSLDGKPFAACSSPFTKRVKPGKHDFAVRAVDKAGNVDASPDSHRWTVKRKRKRR